MSRASRWNLHDLAKVHTLHTHGSAGNQGGEERMVGGNAPNVIRTVARFCDFCVYDVTFSIRR